jgi:hypothetical protein
MVHAPVNFDARPEQARCILELLNKSLSHDSLAPPSKHAILMNGTHHATTCAVLIDVQIPRVHGVAYIEDSHRCERDQSLIQFRKLLHAREGYVTTSCVPRHPKYAVERK